jgi:hypothetical protein
VVDITGSQAIGLRRLVIRGGAVGLAITETSEVDIGSCTIEDNAAAGITVETNSSAWLWGATTVRNNGQFGVLVQVGGTVWFLGGYPAATAANLVEGHSLWGVAVLLSSTAQFDGPNQIRNNGSMAAEASAGIHVGRTSALRLISTAAGTSEISNNTGPGIRAEVNSSITLANATITNNTGAGVALERLSVGEFETGNTFSGNGTFAVSCDASSWAVGDLTGIAPIKCTNVEIKPKHKTSTGLGARELERPPKDE